MEYGRIIKRSLEILWRHKVLWVFGIAAGLWAGGSGGGGSSPNLQYMMNSQDMDGFHHMFPGGLAPSSGWLAALVPILLLVLLFAIALFIVGIIVRYTSLGALAGMVNDIEDREETSFRAGLSIGWARLLRLLGIDLVLFVVTFVVMMFFGILIVLGLFIVIGPTIALASIGKAATVLAVLWAIATGIGLLLLLILVTLALTAISTLIREFAFRAAVIDNQGVFDALGTSWQLTWGNIWRVGLMWLLLLGINLAIALFTVPLALLVSLVIGAAVGIPILLLRAMSAAMGPILAVGIVFAIPLVLLVIGVSALFSGVYTVFGSSVWTLTYRELCGPRAEAS